MASTDPLPSHASEADSEANDVVHRSSFEVTSNRDSTGTHERIAASKKPRIVQKHVDTEAPGDVNSNYLGQTKVDVVLISCPGADPVHTWTRNETIRPWPWTQLREKSSIARILVYDHGELAAKGLQELARDLLQVVNAEIENTKNPSARPIIFICHSIGGLVLKFALVEASRTSEYKPVLENAYGATFFATPHQGSRWLSKPAYSESIKTLLGLSGSLPTKLMAELRPQDATLLSMDQDFKSLASGLRIWSFVECQSSTLWLNGSSWIQYKSPVSLWTSSIVGVHHEKKEWLMATHSNCASFGSQREVRRYLQGLVDDISQADQDAQYRNLQLDQKVSIEVHSFYVPADLGDKGKDSERRWRFSKFEEKFLESFWTSTHGANLKTTVTADERHLETAMEYQTGQKTMAPPAALSTAASGSSDQGRKHLRSRFGSLLTTFSRRSSEFQDLEKGHEISVSGASTHPPPEPGITHAGTSHLDQTGSDPHPNCPPETSSSSSAPARQEPLGPPLASADGSSEGVEEREASLSFKWFHLPFNNPIWVDKVFSTFAKERDRDLSDLFSTEDWLAQHRRARHSHPHAYFLTPTCIYTPMQRDIVTKPENQGSAASEGTRHSLFLCFPFLQVDSYKAHIQRRNVMQKRLSQGCGWPIPEDVRKDDSPLENKYRYPFVRDTRARDDDQMLYKLTKESTFAVPGIIDDEVDGEETHSEEEEADGVLDGNILMVDQLWLWTIDYGDTTQADTVFTCFSKKQGNPQTGHLSQRVDLQNSVVSELKPSPLRSKSTWDLVALIVFKSVTVLMDHSSHPDLELFRIFEEAISILAEMVTSSFKKLRDSQFRIKSDDEVELKNTSMMERHTSEDIDAESKNRDNMSALLELRDIEDELSTLIHLFEEQEKQIRVILEIYRIQVFKDQSHSAGESSQRLLAEAKNKVQSYHEQAREMMKRVANIRQDFDKYLGILQRQAQIDEARLSRQQADLATTQQRSVMIFTVFTVIFLPLSFFTSVFGMNTREWGSAESLHLRTIGLIALPSSSLVILLTLGIALSTSVRNGIKNPKRPIKQSFEWVAGLLPEWLKLLLIKLVLSWMLDFVVSLYAVFSLLFYMLFRSWQVPWQQRWDDKEMKKGIVPKEMAKKDITSQDFWERRKASDDHYEIPRRNRKNIDHGASKSGTNN